MKCFSTSASPHGTKIKAITDNRYLRLEFVNDTANKGYWFGIIINWHI